MISIPLVRRALTTDRLGRHIYLFGPGSVPSEILRRLADAGAEDGTVVLSEDDEERLGVAALFRPRLDVGAIPRFSSIAILALADALETGERCPTPVWPDQVSVEGRTVARSMVEIEPVGDRTGYVVLGAHIDTRALGATRREPIDWNDLIAAFLNALDRWATAYAARGPSAVLGAIRFLPRGLMSA